jgi:hypothetical protein
MADTPPGTVELQQRKGTLMSLLQRLLPIVDGIADSFRFATLAGIGLVLWILYWMHFIHGFEPRTCFWVGGLISLPLLVLGHYWRGLADLQNLPRTVAELMADTRGEIQAQIQSLRSGESRPGVVSAAGRLWEMRDLLGDLRALLGSHLQVGLLVHPLMLVLGLLSLLWVPLLGLAGLILLGIVLVPGLAG